MIIWDSQVLFFKKVQFIIEYIIYCNWSPLWASYFKLY